MKRITLKKNTWESFKKGDKKFIISRSTKDKGWKIIQFLEVDKKPNMWRGFKTKKEAIKKLRGL